MWNRFGSEMTKIVSTRNSNLNRVAPHTPAVWEFSAMQDLFQNVIDQFGIFTAHFDIIK
jgi:hypothetical protein